MPSDSFSEISVEELAEKLGTVVPFILLDVREPWEVDLARIDDARSAICPMSQLAEQGIDALPEPARKNDAEIYVLCHHGVRSVDVTAWLSSQGWKKVFSVAGGIAEYARKIDGSVGTY